MRKLSTIQKQEKLNEVYAVDEKGNGGANHIYKIFKKLPEGSKLVANQEVYINFQNGARNEWGSVCGIIDSDLLEIVRDRLKGFQSGDFKSEYNKKALEHIEIALMYLNRRVEDRIERNVLGTNNK